MNRDALISRLRIHEGLRLKPYKDTEGKLTVGIGRNLDDVGISEDEAIILCGNDILAAEKGLDATCSFWRSLDEVRQQVLCELVFNIGLPRTLGFVKMLSALKAHDYETAAAEMLASKWAGQVGNRARTLAHAMRSGQFLRLEA